MNGSEIRQFVLLPKQGLRALEPSARAMLSNMPVVRSTSDAVVHSLEAAGGRNVRVLDTVSEDGPKLVELDAQAAELTNAPDSPLRAIPVVFYKRPDPRPQAVKLSQPAAVPVPISVICSDQSTGDPVMGANVIAFTDFSARIGDSSVSNAAGEVQLRLSSGTIERLYVYPPQGYWGAFRRSLSTGAPITVDLPPVDLSFVDAVRMYYGGSRFDRTVGVTVGVLDSGVGPHNDLNLPKGRNTVTGEPDSLFADPDGHGTHVAGLIGSDSSPPTGLRGVAPGVALRAYRVFGQNAEGASNYAIMKAMIFAATDECDIINLSLGGGPFDWIVEEAIRDAREHGMLVVVAAGNDDRSPVNFPAAYTGATAISAMGREGTFPVGSLEEADILRPPSSAIDPQEFVASFSNVGSKITMTGLGVGVLSTLPGNGFGPLSGTSMAAPVVAGAAASLLSQYPAIISMKRDRARSDAIEKLIQTNCVRRGFGTTFEGYGLPDPAVV